MTPKEAVSLAGPVTANTTLRSVYHQLDNQEWTPEIEVAIDVILDEIDEQDEEVTLGELGLA